MGYVHKHTDTLAYTFSKRVSKFVQISSVNQKLNTDFHYSVSWLTYIVFVFLITKAYLLLCF